MDVASSTTRPIELSDHPVFAGLDPRRLSAPLAGVRPRQYQAGDTVAQPGGGPALHLLLTGRLCLYELTADGRRIILDYLEAGGVDGMLEVAGMRGHFAAAAAPSVVASIVPAVLDRIVEEEPGFGYNLLAVTVRRLERREAQLERLALRNPDQRIADQLLALAEDCGNDPGATRWWVPRLSHEALADMLALRRETVTLHLGRLRRRGAIGVGRDRFVLERERLEAVRDGHPQRYSSASARSANPSSPPETTRRTPSKSSGSTTAWSRKYPAWVTPGTSRAACAWMDGAPWAEKRTWAQ